MIKPIQTHNQHRPGWAVLSKNRMNVFRKSIIKTEHNCWNWRLKKDIMSKRPQFKVRNDSWIVEQTSVREKFL